MGLLDIKDFNIQVEGGPLEKFKMPDLRKFDGIGDLKAHLRYYMIAMKTIGLKKEQVSQFFAPSLKGATSS